MVALIDSEVAYEAVREIRRHIVQALHQDTSLDTRHIDVTVSGRTVMLTGRVETWRQRESAERAAARTPGVGQVDNRIVVEVPNEQMIEAIDEIP